MNLTASCGTAPLSRPVESRARATCRDCGSSMTRGCLLNNNVWVSPTPMDITILRQLHTWIFGVKREARKVSAWHCPQCHRLDLITK